MTLETRSYLAEKELSAGLERQFWTMGRRKMIDSFSVSTYLGLFGELNHLCGKENP